MLRVWPWVSTLPLYSNNYESLWLYFKKLFKNKKRVSFIKYKTLEKTSLESFNVMKKAKQNCTAVFALGEAGGRGAEGEGCARPTAAFSASPSSSTWQITLGGRKPAATAIILKRLFRSDQILWCKCTSLVGATFN